MKPICSAHKCMDPALARGLCRRHYQQRHAADDLPGPPLAARCSTPHCDRPVKARDLCARHYLESLREGAGRPKCEAPEGCERPGLAKGLCSRHYGRSRRPSRPTPWQLQIATTPQIVEAGSSVLPARFWSRVTVQPNDCWSWTGALHNGYGNFRCVGPEGVSKRRGVHAVAYEAFIGEIPPGLVCDHLCHTNDPTCFEGDSCPHRSCCNPKHIEPVTRRENGQRGHFPGTTHCPQGHPYAGENLRVNALGYDECRTCRRQQRNERYSRLAALRKAMPHYLSERTHCPRGHALAAPNLIASAASRGQRSCLSCGRAGNRVRKARGLGVHLDWQALADQYFNELSSGV